MGNTLYITFHDFRNMDGFSRPSLIIVYFFLYCCNFSIGSEGLGDCSIDDSCEGNHGKEKYIIKG